jgi:hypothetical protein
VDRPPLPTAPAGRSALPAFVALEAWADERLAEARADAAEHVAQARAQAERLRTDGEAKLRETVVRAEREARRTSEDHARDLLSAERIRAARWAEAAEAEAEARVEEALGLLLEE